MAKEKCQANADSAGVCEKIYNALAGNHALRSNHRKSGRSQRPMAAVTAPNQPGVQTTHIAAKTNFPDPLPKPVAQHKSDCPVEVYIPIELGPSAVPKERAKSRVTISPGKEDTPKPVPQTTKPASVIMHIHGPDGAVAPKVASVLPQPEKLKPTTISPGHGQLNKPDVSPLMKEKLKQEKDVSPNIIVIHGYGQGFSNVPPKVEPVKNSTMPLQEKQPNPKLENISTKNGEPKKPEHTTAHDEFSKYIERVKNQLENTLSKPKAHNYA